MKLPLTFLYNQLSAIYTAYSKYESTVNGHEKRNIELLGQQFLKTKMSYKAETA